MPRDEWLAPDDSVRVSQEDCDDAIAANQYQCAIVCAVQRKYPLARRVRVNKNTIAFSIGEQRFRYPTPESAVESIIEPLDTGGKPEPGLVRLKGGLITPVSHKEPDYIVAERRNRRSVIAARIQRHQDNTDKKAGYGRFNKEG